MTKKAFPIILEYSNDEIKPSAVSLLPHKAPVRNNTGVLPLKCHKSATNYLYLTKRMRPHSEPVIDKKNPKAWFITWNHDVPWPLWDKYAPRKRIRIREKDNINRYSGEEREAYAQQRLAIWKYKLDVLKYNPFEDELLLLSDLTRQKVEVIEDIQVVEATIAKEEELSEEDKRKLTSIPVAFEKFMESRRGRKLEPESISAYQGCIDWIYEGLCASGYDQFTISELRHIHLSEALNYIAEDRDWVATTINKGVEFMMTVFNWLAVQEYIVKNPSKGKFEKLPTQKKKHTWYDKDTKTTVIKAISNNTPLLRACQFTYWIMIRSKKELRKLRIGDIDRQLKRVRFSADLSKTNVEEYRDYAPELEVILDQMKLDQYPAGYYIFGEKDGTPSDKQCGHNYFSKMFMAVKEKLKLSMDYTIYGFKHTRIIHELMKGTDGYEISYMARHTDRKSTKDYMRDYDITLKNVYGPEDLTF